MSTRPNLLIVHTDQQSAWTLGCCGGTLIETPHLDSLARDGAKLTNFMINSAVCTPSRGCFITGRYPHQHGSYHNEIALNRDEVTLAHVLQRAGYRTGYVGKWHLDDRTGWIEPGRSMGFEECRYMSQHGYPKGVTEDADGNPAFDRDVNKGRYLTSWITDKTIDVISRQGDDPFFVMMTVQDPHTPYRVCEPYAGMFKPEDMPFPATFRQENLPSWAVDPVEGCGSVFKREDPENTYRKNKAAYCGMVKCIDDNVGRLVDCLREKGILDDTIVVFTTDHGDYMGEHGLYGKNLLFETVYRVPFLVRWPGAIAPGTVVDRVIDTVDFQRTILGLMGIEPSGREQGRDASGLLRGEDIEWVDEAFIHHSHFWFTGIFTREYELGIHNSGEHILFDRKNDPDQMHNLIDDPARRDVVRDLAARVVKHNQDLGSPVCEWITDVPGLEG